MDFNDIISSVAFGIGFLQMYDQVRRQDEEVADDEPVDKKMLYMTLFSSSLWLVYQYRRFGTNISTVYTSAGIIVQLYILKKILDREA